MHEPHAKHAVMMSYPKIHDWTARKQRGYAFFKAIRQGKASNTTAHGRDNRRYAREL